MAHGIFRSDNMAGTTLGKYLVSVKLNADYDNGNAVKLGAYVANEREVRQGATPEATTALGSIAIVAAPEVDPAVKYNSLGDFYNKQNDVVRGYIPVTGDIFSLSADAFATELTSDFVGAVLELQAGKKMSLVASLTSGSTQVATCVAVEQEGGIKWYVFRV